jgi:hypothetical protein
MSYEIVKNIYQNADDSLLAPVKEDGKGYRYAMYYNGFTDAIFADTHEDLLSILLTGYTSCDESEKMDSRIRLAQNVASQLQAEILTEVEEGTLSEEELSILNFPRGLPQPVVSFWKNDVPLIVVDTSYAPYTDVLQPTSALSKGTMDAENLWWIRPVEEEDFLVSLHEVGYIRLLENSNSDDF